MRLCDRACRLGVLGGILALALTAGGCSTSFQLGSMLGKDDVKAEATGSATARPMVSDAVVILPRDGDLAMAKRAAVQVLASGNSDASIPWENPNTGARGTVTPLASAYQQGGNTCHDFLASYVRGNEESWYQGGACRAGKTWEVTAIRPLRRT